MFSVTIVTLLVSVFSLLVFGGLALILATPLGPTDRLVRRAGLAAATVLFTFLTILGLRATVGRGIYDSYLLITGVLLFLAIASFAALADDLLGENEFPSQEA